MTTKGFDAAMVCLNDARQHAIAGADYGLAAAIVELLGKHTVPARCRTCGQPVPAPTQRWHTQPCDDISKEAPKDYTTLRPDMETT